MEDLVVGSHDALGGPVGEVVPSDSDDPGKHTSADSPLPRHLLSPQLVHVEPGVQDRIDMAPAVMSTRKSQAVVIGLPTVQDEHLDGTGVVSPRSINEFLVIKIEKLTCRPTGR